jgi:VWFA-related protein
MVARGILAAVIVASSVVVLGQTPPAEPQQGPTFRTGVELVTFDITATDERGRPVTDLLAPEFLVRIDGKPRRVVSVEHVQYRAGAARRETPAVDETFYTSNIGLPDGRMIMIAVDQLNIRTGAARPLLQSAAKFLGALNPADQVGFVAYPPPGPAIGFTTDHDKIRRAMFQVVGAQSRVTAMKRFNLGVTEAMAIQERRDVMTLEAVTGRECGVASRNELDLCRREIEDEAAQIVRDVRNNAARSMQGLKSLLEDLRYLDGRKSLILISEGLVADQMDAEFGDVTRLAAMARVSINVLLMDVSQADVTQGLLPPTPNQDRQLEMQGLENLASFARGTLFHVVGTGESIFAQLASELSAYYLIGVEQTPQDSDGGWHRIDVDVRRRGVTLRSHRAFVLSSGRAARKPEDHLLDAIRSPFAVAELPIRATTFAFRDPSSERVAVMIAAEVGQAGAEAGDFTVGYALVDDQGRVVASASDKRRLTPIDGRDNAPLGYKAGALVDPGKYTLRIAAVDAKGRKGSVIRDVLAYKMAGEEFAVGDLLLGNAPTTAGGSVEPQLEPHVHGHRLAATVELYAAAPEALEQAAVTVEIADGQDGPTLAAGPARLFPGPHPTTRIAQAVMPTEALPPGRYLARAKISRGGQPAGLLMRPFVLAPSAETTAAGARWDLTGWVTPFDRKAVTDPGVVASMLDMVLKASPALAGAAAAAREGKYGAAAVEALDAGDQSAAMFFRGLDLFMKGQCTQAAVQFHNASGPRRSHFPAAFYLGACFAADGRDREAAGVWQLAIGDQPRPAVAYALFADARLRDGQAESVIEVLEPAHRRDPSDEALAKRLGIAFVMAGRYAEAIPVLDGYLARNQADQDSLFAAIVAHYEAASREGVPLSDVERSKIARYAKAYTGPQQALVAKYVSSLDPK